MKYFYIYSHYGIGFIYLFIFGGWVAMAMAMGWQYGYIVWTNDSHHEPLKSIRLKIKFQTFRKLPVSVLRWHILCWCSLSLWYSMHCFRVFQMEYEHPFVVKNDDVNVYIVCIPHGNHMYSGPWETESKPF